MLDFRLRFTAIGELFANAKFPSLSSIATSIEGRYAGFTTIASMDSADTKMILKS